MNQDLIPTKPTNKGIEETFSIGVNTTRRNPTTVFNKLNLFRVTLFSHLSDLGSALTHVFDSFQRYLLEDEDVDRVRVIKMLGEVEAAMELIRRDCQIDRDEVLTTLLKDIDGSFQRAAEFSKTPIVKSREELISLAEACQIFKKPLKLPGNGFTVWLKSDLLSVRLTK